MQGSRGDTMQTLASCRAVDSRSERLSSMYVHTPGLAARKYTTGACKGRCGDCEQHS